MLVIEIFRTHTWKNNDILLTTLESVDCVDFNLGVIAQALVDPAFDQVRLFFVRGYNAHCGFWLAAQFVFQSFNNFVAGCDFGLVIERIAIALLFAITNIEKF